MIKENTEIFNKVEIINNTGIQLSVTYPFQKLFIYNKSFIKDVMQDYFKSFNKIKIDGQIFDTNPFNSKTKGKITAMGIGLYLPLSFKYIAFDEKPYQYDSISFHTAATFQSILNSITHSKNNAIRLYIVKDYSLQDRYVLAYWLKKGTNIAEQRQYMVQAAKIYLKYLNNGVIEHLNYVSQLQQAVESFKKNKNKITRKQDLQNIFKRIQDKMLVFEYPPIDISKDIKGTFTGKPNIYLHIILTTRNEKGINLGDGIVINNAKVNNYFGENNIIFKIKMNNILEQNNFTFNRNTIKEIYKSMFELNFMKRTALVR